MQLVAGHFQRLSVAAFRSTASDGEIVATDGSSQQGMQRSLIWMKRLGGCRIGLVERAFRKRALITGNSRFRFGYVTSTSSGYMMSGEYKACGAASACGKALGPFLYLIDAREGYVTLAVLMIVPSLARDPDLRTHEGVAAGSTILECGGRRVVRYQFELTCNADASYEVDGQRYHLNLDFEADLRIAFVSCNGQEAGDEGRDRNERNAMWLRLAQQHAVNGFQLLLHGGDQIYADEVLDAHPLLKQWATSSGSFDKVPSDAELGEVAQVLRETLFARYIAVLAEPESAWLMAHIPSLAIWDDHDICDGWGSMEASKLDASIGRLLLSIARAFFLVFQLGSAPDVLPPSVLDRTGQSLTWHIALPNLHVIAPDLRSERRWDRVMGDSGWRSFEDALAKVKSGRVLLLSSVPALGPRLSWVETVLHLFPRMQNLEDDLRDQWQSRAHRAEWRGFLMQLAKLHCNPTTPVTILSGEIHLATRATFGVPPIPMHQLVASGISHPAPTVAYAMALDMLARFGETPIPGRPIRLYPLPGRRSIYVAQRNYLVLERKSGTWTAVWELEKDGPTVPLPL